MPITKPLHAVAIGKEAYLSGYLDKIIGKSVETIHDEGILDPGFNPLSPCSLRAHLAQSSDTEEYTDIQDFDVTEKFADVQNNEVLHSEKCQEGKSQAFI